MLREFIYVVDDEIKLAPICEDCGPNAVPIMRLEELIRCKDCRYHLNEMNTCLKYAPQLVMMDDNDFCSWAERRETC